MATNLDLVPIFPAPYASGRVAGHEALDAALVPWLLQRRDAAGARNGAWESAPDLFEQREPALQALKQEISEALAALVANLGAYSDAELDGLRTQSRAWGAVVAPGFGLPIRSHAMASWCAAYCAQAPDFVAERANGGALSLYDPRLGNMYQDAGNSRLRMPFSFGHFATRAIAGQLAVFPAHLAHEVMPIRGATPLVMVFALFRFVNVAGGAPR